MKKSVIGVVIVALIIIGVIVAVVAGNSKDNSSATNTSTTHTTDNATDAPDSTEAAVPQNTVDITDFSFSPKVITVKKGTKVTWTNKDSSAHTVIPDKSSDFTASDTLEQGESFSTTLNTVGTITYHCSLHSSMTGTIEVTE